MCIRQPCRAWSNYYDSRLSSLSRLDTPTHRLIVNGRILRLGFAVPCTTYMYKKQTRFGFHMHG